MIEDTEKAAGPPTPNPVHDSFNISVLIPEEITIRMVDASALADYEIWFFISSLLGSGFAGFVVAYVQAVDARSASESAIFWMMTILLLLFVASLSMAISKRALLRKKGRTMKLKTSAAGV